MTALVLLMLMAKDALSGKERFSISNSFMGMVILPHFTIWFLLTMSSIQMVRAEYYLSFLVLSKQ